ncbi:MAG: nucleotidyltransferase domain-containing protein [Chloroflexi bacterium]|nr:nucleotidyltransferase domain-containing protein [Chloroflexota bacterium]
MVERELKALMARIVNRLVREYLPEKIILFGSYAYGTPTEDSDIDLFIIKDTDEDRIERFVEVSKLHFEPGYDISVSPLVYTPQELAERVDLGDDFVDEVLTRGQTLYAKLFS